MANCTKYDDPISYNTPIHYNGVCLAPTPPVARAMGGYAYPPPRKKKKKPENEEDEVIAIMLAEFMEDD